MRKYLKKPDEKNSGSTAGSSNCKIIMKRKIDFIDNRSQVTIQDSQRGKNGTPKQQAHPASKTTLQCMSWQESKALKSSDYNDPVADGVSSGGVWMYILKHNDDSYYDIRVHFHAGSSKASKTWTVRWNNEGSGSNVATQKWMRDRVNDYYDAHQK